jgi:2-polyprenyl-3-methyl-5-hydroxy-6-metoxy-1,4-benzoquinol methylase
MDPSFIEAGPCWVCGSSEFRRVHDNIFELSAYRGQDPQLAAYTGATVSLRRCVSCGFAQPDRLPALDRYFARMYDQRWSDDWVAAEFESAAKSAIFEGILDALGRRRQRRPRSLLDVGAHVGKFVALARARGWDAEGIELNATTASFARQHAGVTVHSCGLPALAAAGRRFDAITLTDVLEHIPYPLQALRDAAGVLNSGGWIAVKVPSGPNQLRKERLRTLAGRTERVSVADNLVHVSHFSPRALRIALARAGFGSISIHVGAPEQSDRAGWRAVMSNAARNGAFVAARVLGGARSPLAFNLQAYARLGDRG